MTLDDIIKQAKLGRARKEAQEDCCAEFAAALYDVLAEFKVPSSLYVVRLDLYSEPAYHTVVKVKDTYYDSMGVFSEKSLRANLKIHPKVQFKLKFKRDKRKGIFDDDMIGMYEFYKEKLVKVFQKLSRSDLNKLLI